MLTHLDQAISLPVVIWAFPVVFLIHDLEEVFTAERFWAANRGRLPLVTRFTTRIEVTTRMFAVAVAILFVVVLAATFAASGTLRRGVAIDIFAIAVVLLLLNVFTHAGQSVLLRIYSPGVISAILVVLPYTLYTLHRLDATELISRDLGPWALLAVILTRPSLLVLYGTARRLTLTRLR